MITLYTSSLWIGGIFGFVIGVAISFFSIYLAEKDIHDRFSDGWDAGVKYGKTVKEAAIEVQKNPPLTWEQLKQMDHQILFDQKERE